MICVKFPWCDRYLYDCELQVSYLSSFVEWCFVWILFIYIICWPYIFITCYMCCFDVATLLLRYFFTSSTVIPRHDWKYPFLISLIHVDLTGMHSSAWRYLTKYVWFVMWYSMLVLCNMSLSSGVLLFSKGDIHNPVALCLVPVKMVFLSLWCGCLCA